jgi:hypothetical protein
MFKFFHAEAGNEVNVLVLPSKFSVKVLNDCADTLGIQQAIMPATNKILNFLMIFNFKNFNFCFYFNLY